ncbi:Uncharacterized protein BP5553_04396 [Venustampulla echinocandica]|uniref:Late endosomal/lysosomal adaptor and MAPK and MTOR activator-domain-containing protein n=1 Tax=Venustampulla echinocandica TaxID=2656787 RepID=A0A370TN47_9HELO|nr:Uncharacterized protein BP5553_04396 [Venustampulla echinocandica]RDL36963.1 Uncharacterized protein BP5553_04396 [Venustampulla echinocandica]
MGACSSCLGRDTGRDRDLSDEDESARLLFDDAHANQYGSFGEHHTGAVPADPQEVQRETEALQKVVAQTSNRLVDIFAMVPQTGPSPASTVFPAQDAKILRYQDVLAEMSAHDQPSKARQVSAENTPNVSDGWISEDDDGEEMKRYKPVKSEGIGPLLGGFADAEPAMG